MKVLICNAGSTSLKYKLYDMDQGEAVLASGVAERVGTEKSSFYHKCSVSSDTQRVSTAFPTHREAIMTML